MENSAACPNIEYYVVTDEGRTFIWSAPHMEWLLRDLIEKGHRPKFIQEYAEYLRSVETA